MDCAADLGRTVTLCAKHDLGGMEGLIGVPGTVGGALRMNAGAYGTQIGILRPRGASLPRGRPAGSKPCSGTEINFEYRHTSFAPDDIMLAVRLELPSKPYSEILQGIRICNEKRRASQPLNQKSAGCIFKNPPGGSAGRMIDELGLKGFSVGDARVSDRHANFFVNAGHATAADMLALIARRARTRARHAYGVELEEEVIVWKECMSAEPDYLSRGCAGRRGAAAISGGRSRWRFAGASSAARPGRCIAAGACGGNRCDCRGLVLYEAGHYFLFSPGVHAGERRPD